jgi:hypothetical protein
MKKIFFTIVISFFLLSGINLFPQGNSLTAQPQMGQPRMAQPLNTASLTQELLDRYSLPAGTITEDDIPRIKTVIEQVLNKISESLKSAGQAGNKSDVRPIMSGILIFQDWLTKQGCVEQASNWYVEGTDKYHDHIFLNYPGQVPFDILFDMGADIEKKDSLYRLLIFVTTVDLLRFASLIENKTVIVWRGQKVLYLVPSSQ